MPAVSRRAAALVVGFGVLAAAVTAPVAAPAADAIILPDGFTVQGRVIKERNPAGYSFDVLEDGPKILVFSRHTAKGAKVESDVQGPKLVAYKRPFPGTRNLKVPPAGEMSADDFDAKWMRTLKVKPQTGGGAPHEVRQMITYLDPYSCYVSSVSHGWRVAYHTAEMEPKQVRSLLANHAELKEEPNKPDPMKRLAIATFMKDVGWLDKARDEIARAKLDAPGNWPKEPADRLAELRTEIDLAETRGTIDDLEAAVGSGRYAAARRLLTGFAPKATDQKETTRLAVLKAQVETIGPKYQETARLLTDVIALGGGGTPAGTATAAVGGTPLPFAQVGPPDTTAAPLLPAARAVLAELHPDTAGRIELFTNLARQADQRRRDGKDPGAKPAALLALAVTGWLKGKNGADPDPANAARCWATRQMATAYLRSEFPGDRVAMLDEYQRAGAAVPPDELAQLVSLLPPPFAADLSVPPGAELPKADALVRGVYKVTVPGPPELTYYLRLPPEYHHGRSYPVILALSHPTFPAAKLVGSLADYADRNGYLVAALEWGNQFAGGYDFSGDEHPLALAVLRDVFRRYQADPDRAFLFGFGEGANFAIDLGLAHPDHFAGAVLFGPAPQHGMFMQYWANAQKLPIFAVTGEMSGGSAPGLRKLFERWMPRGYPALMTMYRGRGVEWYGMELPRAFDWMGRKTRVRGTASLKLNTAVIEPWVTGRDEDNRFYWVGTTGIQSAYQMKGKIGGGWVPATVAADIRQGNEIIVTTRGLKTVVLWLERDMIDWTRPVKVLLNGQPPFKYVAKVLAPDLGVMFEEVHRTGDRKMLFLGRLEFATP